MAVECGFCGSASTYLTVTQAARLLGRSEVQVRKLCRLGRIPADRVTVHDKLTVWRIPASAIIPLLEAPSGS